MLILKFRSVASGNLKKKGKYSKRNKVLFLPSKTNGYMRFYFENDWN